MRKYTCGFLLAVLLASSGCGANNTASIPSEYGDSQLPAEPPAMQGQVGGLQPGSGQAVEAPKLEL